MEAINNVQNKTRFTPKFIASVGILFGYIYCTYADSRISYPVYAAVSKV